MDKSKRITLIKEVSEILQADEKDYLLFYLDGGEVIIRKNLPEKSLSGVGDYSKFWEWARKRQIEIDLTTNTDEKELMQSDLDDKINAMKDMEEIKSISINQ